MVDGRNIAPNPFLLLSSINQYYEYDMQVYRNHSNGCSAQSIRQYCDVHYLAAR